jgi:hypothetical protein
MFQKSNIRIEVLASAEELRKNLTHPEQLQKWLRTQQFPPGLPEQFQQGLTFITWIGPIPIQHDVKAVEANRLLLLLSQGIDGFHEWYWGEGWVQSHLEGISLLPLNLGQTISLLQLRQFLNSLSKA